MKEVKILIVEDEPIIADDLSRTLYELNYSVIGMSHSGEDAIEKLKTVSPDLVLLDINLGGGIDGVEVAQHINEHHNLPIIFLTSFADKATIDRVKVTKPAGYIVKPFDDKDLQTNIELALYNFHNDEDSDDRPRGELLFHNQIFVKDNSQFKKIDINDIFYAKADDNYTEIYTVSGKYLISSTLKVIESKLPTAFFLRIHRSYLVNIKKIDGIGSSSVSLNGNDIPIGKSYKNQLMQSVNLI